MRASYYFISVDVSDLLGHEHSCPESAVGQGCQDTLRDVEQEKQTFPNLQILLRGQIESFRVAQVAW